MVTNKLFFSVLILLLGLFATQCGAAPAEPAGERITQVIGVDIESILLEEKVIATEEIPLNNCGGNSPLVIDVERSREFTYVVVDKSGYEFGLDSYGLLVEFLQKEYSVIDGETEKQTHTIHLETEANSHVIYTIAWKETWLNGKAMILRENRETSHESYKIKKGLTLGIEEVKKVNCE